MPHSDSVIPSSPPTWKTDEQGAEIGDAVTLKEAFFQNPSDFRRRRWGERSAAPPHQRSVQRIGRAHVDDLRNFLFGPAAGMDLASINLQRGRDLGLGTFE